MKKAVSKFRIENPISTDRIQELKADMYSQQVNADKFVSIDSKKNDKPTRGFNVPLNDYELELLRKVCAQYDRSARKITRRLLVEALENELIKLN